MRTTFPKKALNKTKGKLLHVAAHAILYACESFSLAPSHENPCKEACEEVSFLQVCL